MMGMLWFVFLLVVHLLFLSLVLDTLCAGYMKTEEDDKEEMVQQKAEGIVRAFELLNEGSHEAPHRVSVNTFIEFLQEYSKSPAVHPVNEAYARISFAEVDKDGDGKIDENEFTELCVLLQYQMWVTRRDSMLKDTFPTIWDSRRSLGCIASVTDIRTSVRDPHGLFETIMTFVLTVNFFLVILETTYDLSDAPEPAWTAWLEFVFSFIYLGECMFKIGVSGWDFYSSSTSNIFDFGTTMLLLSTSIFESMLGALSTYANILRLFRLLRVVKQLKGLDRVQFMVSTVIKMVKKAKDMLVLLLVVIFGFTVVGVQLFGGQLYEENPKLEETDYHENKEYVLNFNDFLMAFGLWFVHLLTEYKPSFAQAIHEVSRNGTCNSLPPVSFNATGVDTSAVASQCGLPERLLSSLQNSSWLICPLFWGVAVCITLSSSRHSRLKSTWTSRKSGSLRTRMRRRSTRGLSLGRFTVAMTKETTSSGISASMLTRMSSKK